ncbi:hypothetical protein [uncultured Rikenella sp.]|uniref:hypothetical protein n=1 Tax=uncultured Rikenella sp. TaxID=368003 RepID=UPI00263913B4|nr:hypothetical protein [uncultured Rikenella sp.]
MENNDYYEPTIKTSRVDEITKEQALKLLDTITKDRNNLKNEKQQLISFLKSEIATKNEILDKKQKYDNNYYIICGERSECHRILDFVNKGGKDE